MTNYKVVKKLIERINKLDHSYHYDIFNILCRHNKLYSKNNNGFFFDFQNLEDNIILDVLTFMDGLEQNLNKLSTTRDTSCDKTTNSTGDKLDVESSGCENENENENTSISSKENTTNQITLHQECVNTLLRLDIDHDLTLKPLLNTIGKDKTVTKKTTNNKFTLAKKKYSKPIVQDTKYTLDDLLYIE